MITFTEDRIEVTPMLAAARLPEAGAVVLFLGVTRRFTGDRETTRLAYQAYREMAVRELEKLEREARRRWSIAECLIEHRLGDVPAGEDSVAIVVASAHRKEAFEAGQWLIDSLKESVPIWKQEHWTDGDSDWVHPNPDAG
ncbi:MAG: molybdenum cofactor biosynthesis protein MoaE [Planctomycetota bacterium]